MAIVKEGAEIARVTEPGAVRQQRLRIFAEGSRRACRSEANYSQPLGNSPFIYKALVVMHGPKGCGEPCQNIAGAWHELRLRRSGSAIPEFGYVE